MDSSCSSTKIRVDRTSPTLWRLIFHNPPLNVMGADFVLQFRELIGWLEQDEQVKVVTFESSVEAFFLNHSDFLAKLEDLTRIPVGPTGLEAWPDILVRLTRLP